MVQAGPSLFMPHHAPLKMDSSYTQLHQAESRLADKADKHHIYQFMLQSPEADIELIQTIYRSSTGRDGKHLREDFCGTGYTLARWVAQDTSFSGEGFDIDPDPIDWGWHNNFAPLGDAAIRGKLHLKDVREPSVEAPDIRCAFNFSYWVFRKREEMLGYFTAAYKDLPEHGMFIIDVTGGTDSLSEEPFESENGEISCIWQQQNYSPVNHTADLTIRFRFSDGSEIEPPYRYRWRVWTIPELQDLLTVAGFSSIEVWWQGDEFDSIDYHVTDKGRNDPCWVACIAAIK